MRAAYETSKIIGFTVAVAGAALLTMAGCDDDEAGTSPPPGCSLSGMVTSLAGATYQGGAYVYYIDVDPDPDNGNHAKSFTGIFPDSVLFYNYDIADVTPGTYYLHMTIDLGQGPFHVGYYGAAPMPWDTPAAPNADVACGASFDFNIYD